MTTKKEIENWVNTLNEKELKKTLTQIIEFPKSIQYTHKIIQEHHKLHHYPLGNLKH